MASANTTSHLSLVRVDWYGLEVSDRTFCGERNGESERAPVSMVHTIPFAYLQRRPPGGGRYSGCGCVKVSRSCSLVSKKINCAGRRRTASQLLQQQFRILAGKEPERKKS